MQNPRLVVPGSLRGDRTLEGHLERRISESLTLLLSNTGLSLSPSSLPVQPLLPPALSTPYIAPLPKPWTSTPELSLQAFRTGTVGDFKRIRAMSVKYTRTSLRQAQNTLLS